MRPLRRSRHETAGSVWLDNACYNMYCYAMPSRLQAEIKQTKPFERLEHEAALGVLRTAAVLDHMMAEVFRPFGITPTQFNVLRILRGAGEKGLCGREVSERMVTRVPDIPRLLDRMEKAGLISRERDVDDRRHVTARITRKGLDLLDDVAREAPAPVEDRFGRLSESQLRALIDALDVVREG